MILKISQVVVSADAMLKDTETTTELIDIEAKLNTTLYNELSKAFSLLHQRTSFFISITISHQSYISVFTKMVFIAPSKKDHLKGLSSSTITSLKLVS